VPVLEEGVTLQSKGRKFEVSEGQVIDVSASGRADIGRGPVSPEGESGYQDNSMDSPFKDHVGGLEMWVGPDKNSNRYFVGLGGKIRVGQSGVLTFRVIESIRGYHDGDDSGSFDVIVRKASNGKDDASGKKPNARSLVARTRAMAGREFVVGLEGSGFDPATVRIIVTGPGCERFADCVVPNNVLR